MKQKLLMMTIGAMACLWLAAAQAATPSPQFLGAWTVDLSKQPAGDPGKTPKSVTVTVTDVGGGKWTTATVIELADGTKQTPPPSSPVNMDGSTTIAGNPQIDTITVTCPDSNTVIVTVLKDGRTVETETSKLSPDGKQMTHTIDATGPDGSPMHVVQILNKKS